MKADSNENEEPADKRPYEKAEENILAKMTGNKWPIWLPASVLFRKCNG